MSYSKDFYSRRKPLSRSSAEIVLGALLDVARIESVVDFGCGTGSWLNVALTKSVRKILGYDSSQVPPEELEIHQTFFRPTNLENVTRIEGEFDLAICLEVIEHLSEQSSDRVLCALVESSDLILFSGAIPYQVGTNHVNCQWQTHWSSKFREHGFLGLPILNGCFWKESRINVVYRQNMVLYFKCDKPKDFPLYDAVVNKFACSENVQDVVHPELFELYLTKLYAPRF